MTKTGNPICPVCGTPVESGDDKIVCPSCKVTFHQECWQDNKGCSTYGCKQVNILNPPMKLDIPGASHSSGVNRDQMLRQLAERLNRGEIDQATYQRIYSEMMAAPIQAPPMPPVAPSPFTAPPPPFAGQPLRPTAPPSPFVGQQPMGGYHNAPPSYAPPEESWYFGYEFVKAWKNIGQTGRSRRRDYWMFWLYYSLIMFMSLFFLGVAVGISGGSDETAETLGAMWYLFSFVVYLPAIWLSIRRLHDTGNSGWWLLAAFLLPIIGPLVFLILTLQDSVPGDNEWGSNPKGIDDNE